MLAISAFISTAQAQTVSCSSGSPQCCWALKVVQGMGQSVTGYSTTSTSGCCSYPGIICDATKRKVVSLSFGSKGLTGSIPSDIGKLISITSM